MSSLSRGLLRWGIIGGLALGGLTILIGPDRVGAAFDQLRMKARQAADDFVDDPIALRRQLQSLAEQYPTRIGQVRGELAEVERQMSQLAHDSEVAKRVVTMASDDLNRLRVAVSEGEPVSGQLIALRESQFASGKKSAIDVAKEEARRINNVRMSYQDRYASNKQQLEFLGQQKERLSKILQRLETEYSDFETKMAVLDRQIDSIERNERLIDMSKEQQAMLAEYDKFGEVGNLGQLESKLAELRTVQEAQLEALAKAGVPSDYEQRAKADIADERWNSEDPLGLEPTAPASGSPSSASAGKPQGTNPESSLSGSISKTAHRKSSI
jgi:chromosome segregation ATPase